MERRQFLNWESYTLVWTGHFEEFRPETKKLMVKNPPGNAGDAEFNPW